MLVGVVVQQGEVHKTDVMSLIKHRCPVGSYTQQQCCQAPVLEAILPKLHLNRHTHRAVLFAGPSYGGNSLPEKYNDQGYLRLHMLVGHVKLHDDVGQLITCLITHTQLQLGSNIPFFNLQYSKYADWIDTTRITLDWKYAHQSGIQIEVENHWVPQLTHENDCMLMDKAIREGFTTLDLQGIMCHMYLQVFTLSDIITAKGDRLLPEISHNRHLH